MKFLVKVVRATANGERILGRLEIEESSPRKARTKADLLLAPWRSRGATATRLVKKPGNGGARRRASGRRGRMNPSAAATFSSSDSPLIAAESGIR